MDKQNLQQIYEENVSYVYKYLFCLTHDTDLAEELTQETFYEATKGIHKFRGDCKIAVWLCQIGKRLWFKELKRRKKQFLPLDDMVCELKTDKMPQNQDLKRYLNKTKQMYLLKGILLSIGILGLFVSFCVDVAINRKLTWSLIVDMGILYSYAVLYTAIMIKKYKVFSTTIVASLLLLPMLWGIESVINSNFLIQPIYWFKEYALPISLIWIVILNGIVLFYYLSRKLWYTLGVALILCAAGSILTEAIAEHLSIFESLYYGLKWIDAIAYLACGILCIIIGYVRRSKQK